MARTNNLTNFLTDVADAIRSKKGTQATIQASDFDTEILSIPSGGLATIADLHYPLKLSQCDFYSGLPDYYKNADWSLITDFDEMFRQISLPTNYIFPLINTSNGTNFTYAFFNVNSVIEFPQFNLSNGVDFNSCFYACHDLVTIPVYNLGNAGRISTMFCDCENLSNTSLNNILATCLTVDIQKITVTPLYDKEAPTLTTLGLSQTQIDTCKTLSNYTAFLNAGWIAGDECTINVDLAAIRALSGTSNSYNVPYNSELAMIQPNSNVGNSNVCQKITLHDPNTSEDVIIQRTNGTTLYRSTDNTLELRFNGNWGYDPTNTFEIYDVAYTPIP